ncbi:unnamed protein product [Pleuronectes platessa]|uniref:Uncharacterized protein n=1 Tax=Pleuronectes platessa TaxID=8262 RepID=A0A9N7YJ31_PLEPL|nr:unnamed protein product [Pleuronectes platessa]
MQGTVHGLGPPPTIISLAPGRDGPASRLAFFHELAGANASQAGAPGSRFTLSPGRSLAARAPAGAGAASFHTVEHLSGRINMPIVEAETPGTPLKVDSTVWKDAAAAPAPAPTAGLRWGAGALAARLRPT